MPQPTVTAVHTNGPLTNISVAYIQNQAAFIAARVFPIVTVDKKSDTYYQYTKNDWFRDEAAPRAPSTESAGGGYNFDTSPSYNCKRNAFHKDIDDEIRGNYDQPLDPDRDATEFVTQKILLRQEIAWTTAYFGSGIWATDTTPTNLWSDYTSSDPIGDVRTGIRTILANTGYRPNKLVLGYDVFTKLQDHPDIVDRLKYTGGASKAVTREQLAALFDIDEVLVCEAIKATNLEGETAAMDFVQGKHALLVFAAPRPSLMLPSGGYIFAWKGISGGLGKSVSVKKFRMENLTSDRVEAEYAFDQKLVASDMGYMFPSVVS